jgi:hypothetical protein
MMGKILFMIVVSGFLALLTPPSSRAFGQTAEIEGFYISSFAGLAVLDSTVSFPATENRPAAKFVDQGGDGAIFGGRVGWGRLVTQHVYLGGELEGVFPWGVTSRLMAFGVEYRARLQAEAGAYGRIGWSVRGGEKVGHWSGGMMLLRAA